MEGPRTPAPPRGTGPGGRKLWRSVLIDLDLELDPHELLLLTQAVRCVDRLDAMHAELVDAPLTVRNSRGDMVAHPLIVESRQQSKLLASLLASLRLPSGLSDEPGGELHRPQRRGAARGAYGLRRVQ